MLSVAGALAACQGKSVGAAADTDTMTVNVPAFDADSAYASIETQCAFGPRVPGTEAHTACGDYIVAAFRALGLTVTEQRAQVITWEGRSMPCRNIIAAFNPDARDRVLLGRP